MPDIKISNRVVIPPAHKCSMLSVSVCKSFSLDVLCMCCISSLQSQSQNGKLTGLDEVKLEVKKICRVCSDTASGNHFGVMTCEACKSFFRRSIRASAKYYCNNHNSCVIDKRNRNRCQACRLRKCLDSGMQPECESLPLCTARRCIVPGNTSTPGHEVTSCV